MDIRKSNSAYFEMAISDFFHCENLPHRAVESNRFCKIMDVAKVVGSGFTIPRRNKIGGELLFKKLKLVQKIFLQNILFIHRGIFKAELQKHIIQQPPLMTSNHSMPALYPSYIPIPQCTIQPYLLAQPSPWPTPSSNGPSAHESPAIAT